MIIGVPREIKPGEQRVALTPAGARALVEGAHGVLVERGAGGGSGIRDEEYAGVGADANGEIGFFPDGRRGEGVAARHDNAVRKYEYPESGR